MKLDKDTQKVLSEGEQIANLVQSDGWRLVRMRLFNKITDLNSVLGITGKTNEEILRELGVRQEAVKTLFDWLREIEGTAAGHQTNAELFKKDMQENYLISIEES